MCVFHPCSLFLDVHSVLLLFYLTTCVCVCLSFPGPWRECLRARRFQATLLLHLHLCACCNWRSTCVDPNPKKKKSGTEVVREWLWQPGLSKAPRSDFQTRSADSPGAYRVFRPALREKQSQQKSKMCTPRKKNQDVWSRTSPFLSLTFFFLCVFCCHTASAPSTSGTHTGGAVMR